MHMVSSNCGFVFGFVVQIPIFGSHLCYRQTSHKGGSIPHPMGQILMLEGKYLIHYYSILLLEGGKAKLVIRDFCFGLVLFLQGQGQPILNALLQPHSGCLRGIFPEAPLLTWQHTIELSGRPKRCSAFDLCRVDFLRPSRVIPSGMMVVEMSCKACLIIASFKCGGFQLSEFWAFRGYLLSPSCCL